MYFRRGGHRGDASESVDALCHTMRKKIRHKTLPPMRCRNDNYDGCLE